MSVNPNEYHLVTFDPGGTIGYSHFTLDIRAFTRPENKVLAHVTDWECGEFEGEENIQCASASRLIWQARFGDMPFNNPTDVLSSGLSKSDILSEDFELTQMIGGKNLLSPVRINAKLDWICDQWGLKLNLQRRSMRTGVTPERLLRYGFQSPLSRSGKWTKTGNGKDAFAAMQHAIVWLRRVKADANRRPWKLAHGGVANSRWDCACSRGKRCDLNHLR